ncbi:hypothetical protein BD626DRAFT_548504 [Schizophyllum amplum]|uniref:DUF7918 domain-containing protein n=1 Tax=Schizophyllum amplum TaxID=97359 RepID=A0A550CCX6_9AGAR|nr:hypothetical protein BD626DRAFT_548504 [Auriculariopsis ampla]
MARREIMSRDVTPPWFEAFIVSNNYILPEYGFTPVGDDTIEVACWIESKPGEKFTVVWRDHGSGYKTAGYIYLDGVVVPGRFLDGSGETLRTGVRSGKSTERPFIFSQVTKDDTEEKTKDQLPDVGTIKLKIKRCETQATVGRPANPVVPYPERLVGMRKMGETCIGLGNARSYFMQDRYTYKIHGPGRKKPPTVVSFVFKYRPTCRGVPATPDPVEAEVPVLHDTVAGPDPRAEAAGTGSSGFYAWQDQGPSNASTPDSQANTPTPK